MIEQEKAVESLSVTDLKATPVWHYLNRDGAGETIVRVVKKMPVTDLTGKLIGTQVRFANGAQAWALIGSIDPRNSRLTEHFLTLSIEHAARWFSPGRYHDFDYADRGPEALSRFLGMAVDDIFPIAFDVRQYAEGDPAALKGSVLKEPREKLFRAEVIAMVVP